MTIFIGSDHAGFEIKEVLITDLESRGYEVIDKGAYEYSKDDDYPDFVKEVAVAVADNPDEDRGIVLGGSGQGEAMVVNRFPGVRAAVYYGGPEEIITLSREHNDANVLSLGARFIDKASISALVDTWLKTPFSEEERHIRRLKKLEQLFD